MTHKPSNQNAVDELRWHKFPVTSDGFVCLVDCMGDDAAVVQAARVSYGTGTQRVSDDRTLIRYLLRHRHTTPFEMAELKFLIRVPMDCWRQWIRHRTACLSGDTKLIFSRPCDGKSYSLTVKEVFDRFQPTENSQRPDKQGNPLFKCNRIESMRLRCLNESTNDIQHTSVVDIWESGVKPVFRVTVANGNSIRCSKDHRILTPVGWRTLQDLSVGDQVLTACSRFGRREARFNAVDESSEEWASIPGWNEYYEVSDHGRVRRIAGGRGSRSRGRCKRITVSKDRAVTSLNSPGRQETILIHNVMLRAFVGDPPLPGLVACHRDGNPLNNVLENLYWGSSQDNANDMKKHGTSTFLTGQPQEIVSIAMDGEEMTYDLEVSGEWHNFSANGIIVHNSVNEYSTRYSVAIDSMQETAPDQWRVQASDNKQGSNGFLPEDRGGYFSVTEKLLQSVARDVYKERIEAGVAREQARKDLPLSTYTEAYWKIDLHNLLHFLALRMDSHAQQEIRDFATAIGEHIVQPLFPVVWEAFLDYRMNAITLTGPEVSIIASASAGDDVKVKSIAASMSKREFIEFLNKASMLGVKVPIAE